jgi:predicted transcriptional regulator
LNSRKDAKGLIIKVLREHPEGLMLIEIAKITGMNRFTITKYVHELVGNGSVFQKEAAAAKMCYLKEDIIKKLKERNIDEKLQEGLK